MLKFSGFADLTSCLGKEKRARDSRRCEAATHAQARNERQSTSFKLPGARETNALNASREERSSPRPDAQKHAVGLPYKKALVAGMRRSRH